MISCIINILVLFSLWTFDGQQDPQVQQTDIQGVIKLAKYASWPAENQNRKTVIMIAPLSDETFQLALDNAADSKISDNDVEIRRIEKIDDDILKADIIFVESGSGVDAEKVLQIVSGRQILTITNDMDILDKGFMFYVRQDYDTGQTIYLFNKEAVQTSPLGINSLILLPDHKYQRK